MSAETRIKAWKKKTITKDELGELLHTGSEAELFAEVSEAVNAGLLAPVKATGTNGNRAYPLYLKYKITWAEDHSAALDEIALLHPALTQNGYLSSKPEQYIKYRDALQKLDRYMFSKRSTVAISKKERSFAIFGEEKQLEDSSLVSLLTAIGLTPEKLCYYETPEYCFNDYIPQKKQRMTLLICENKDIWFNIRRRMYEDGADEIFGTPIDGAVYGRGNSISEVGALSQYTHFMQCEEIQYLYWGDIDRAGLNIYLSLRKNNPGMNIALFVPAYEKMLRAARGRTIPNSADMREILGNYEEIYSLFPEDLCSELKAYIADNKRLPQEIVSYETLLTEMRKHA